MSNPITRSSRKREKQDKQLREQSFDMSGDCWGCRRSDCADRHFYEVENCSDYLPAIPILQALRERKRKDAA
jgi:hypothetical protein